LEETSAPGEKLHETNPLSSEEKAKSEKKKKKKQLKALRALRGGKSYLCARSPHTGENYI
jgi:hypothetical protein